MNPPPASVTGLWHRLRPVGFYAFPVAVLVVGLVLSVLVAGLQRKVQVEDTVGRFQTEVDLTVAGVESAVDMAVGSARGAAGLISGSVDVSQAEFSVGMSTVDAGVGPPVRATNFIKRVADADVTDQAARRAEEDPSFGVFPTVDAPFHAIVWLVYPLISNRAALGFDVLSTPAAAAAIRRSEATGRATMSEALALVQDPTESTGFVVYVPVERPGDGLVGWTTAVFSGQAFVEAAAGDRQDLAVRVTDVSGDLPQVIGATPSGQSFGGGDLAASRTIVVYGREWRLDVEATPSFPRTDQGPETALVFAMGVFITMLAALLSLQGRRSSARAAQMVRSSTAELEEANIALVDALDAKDAFLSVVSHEFRTPLTVIEGSAELMADETLDPGLRAELVERVYRNAKRLGTLVTDLLVAAQIENGKIEVAPESVAVADVVGTVVGDLGHVASDVSYADDGRVVAVVDPLHLGLMISNLVSNAYKYGAPPVEITSRHDGRSAVITVRDHGPGVPEGAVSRLFHRFEQADSSRTRETSGVGLGLSIVQRLAHLNGGSIAYVGGRGGAAFEITLPAAVTGVRLTESV